MKIGDYVYASHYSRLSRIKIVKETPKQFILEHGVRLWKEPANEYNGYLRSVGSSSGYSSTAYYLPDKKLEEQYQTQIVREKYMKKLDSMKLVTDLDFMVSVISLELP
jgi:hypothetical protein